MNGATQIKLMTLAEHGRKLYAFMTASDKGVHARGFHDGHMSGNAAPVDQGEVFWASAKNHRLTVLTLNRLGKIKS